MKTKLLYEAPALQTEEIRVEAGIAQTGGPGQTGDVFYDPENNDFIF